MDTITNLSSTPQGLAILSASIGAFAALFAQLLAGIVNLVRDLIMEKIRSQRRAKLAAVICTSELQKFMEQCQDSVDNWHLNVDPNDIMDVSFPVPVYKMNLPSNADLEFIDVHSVAWLFHLKSKATEIERKSDPAGHPPPHYGGVAEYRRDAYIDLSRHASLVHARLQKEYDLPTSKG